jgi:putative ABC transport system permease protein
MSDRGPSPATGYRLATRLARREVLRRPGRTLLVALLVAVPVAGMFVADAMVRTNHLTQAQLWHSEWGEADALFSASTPQQVATLRAELPAGTHTVAIHEFADPQVMRVAGGADTAVEVSHIPLRDPITNGIVQLMSGRMPARPGEVLLTRTTAHALHVHAGQTLRLTAPARQTFVVTGVGEYSEAWGQSSMIVPPGTVLPWKAPKLGVGQILVKVAPGTDPRALVPVSSRVTESDVGLELSPALGRHVDYGAADTQRKVRWSWVIGALVLTVAGIVIASAFAMGARRQLVTLGQLAANGAPPTTLRRVLFLQGTWTGLIGAIGGFGLGALALVALTSHASAIFHRSVHPWTISAGDVAPIFLLGVITATIAALLPARTTSRVPVLAALAGRRPLGRVPRWLPLAGALAAAGGLALLALAVIGSRGSADITGNSQVWIITAIIGGVAVLLGACAVAPAYVSVLGPLAGRAQGSSRIAVRSLARQRTRTSAVVSAIAATSALAIAATSLVLSAHLERERGADYVRADEAQLVSFGATGTNAPTAAFVAKARHILPKETSVLRTNMPARTGVTWTIRSFAFDHAQADENGTLLSSESPIVGVPTVIVTPAVIDDYALGGDERAKLAHSGALYLGDESFPIGKGDGHAVISLDVHANAAPGTRTRRFSVPLVDAVHARIGAMPRLLVTPALATRLGMHAVPGPVVLRSPHNLTAVQRTRLNSLDDVSPSSVVDYTPPGGLDPLLVQWALVGISLVMVLFVVAVNLALSAAETRDERDVLTVVGAAPAVMRRANGYKAALQTVMGALLAIPIGFLPVVVFVTADNSTRPLVFPWAVVAMLVVALPVVGGLVTTAASGLALRFRPVRVSTMAYD